MNFVLEHLKIVFDLEISNNISFNGNELVVDLQNGNKAKITTKKIA